MHGFSCMRLNTVPELSGYVVYFRRELVSTTYTFIRNRIKPQLLWRLQVYFLFYRALRSLGRVNVPEVVWPEPSHIRMLNYIALGYSVSNKFIKENTTD